MTTRTIRVDYLARVEGEGSLLIRARGTRLTEVKFKIFEPPRFFEAFLRGRDYREAPDITARICGICPVAYQMSAVSAMEDALGISVDGQIRDLRRLLYCGEWIESHGLHVFMLHAPDFLGYADAIQMAQDHPQLVADALRLKKAGNEIMRVIGGREIHPINVRVGGFYRAPLKSELAALTVELEWAREKARDAALWAAALPMPDFEQDYLFASLRHEEEYPIARGRIVSSEGLDIPYSAYNQHFQERQVDYSNALQSVTREGRSYLAGPLARYNLNYDNLSSDAQGVAREAGLGPTELNGFKSIIVRCVEIFYACEEALRLIREYERPDRPFFEANPEADPVETEGHGCTEAPRGLLYHRYKIAGDGSILEAQIVPPTSQNQKAIEDDLWDFVPPRLDMQKDELTRQCEQLIRNYDPCISCATHFLNLQLEREEKGALD